MIDICAKLSAQAQVHNSVTQKCTDLSAAACAYAFACEGPTLARCTPHHAQGLRAPITSATKLQMLNQTLYLAVERMAGDRYRAERMSGIWSNLHAIFSGSTA